MIHREQVADLQAGDVVRVTHWYGLTVEGPLTSSNVEDSLWLGQHILVRDGSDGNPGRMVANPENTLTLVARAPQPLYVNHPRTEPAYGDVVDDPEGHEPGVGPWLKGRGDDWYSPAGKTITPVPRGWRLLVDGETGQVVQ